MLGSHEDEYIGYGEPYMVPTQRRSNSFQTPETSRHNSLSSPGSGDGPCSSQRVDDSSLLFSRIYDDCSGSSNDSVDVHCLLQHVKSSVPQVSGNFVEELSFALDSGCIGQCVSKAQFLDAVSFSVPDINQNRYGSPRECSQHQQNILQLEHTVRLLRQERDESHQQIQQLEGQYLSLTSQVHRLSSTNSSLSLEAERCRELSAECEYLQSSLAAEQRGRAEAVSSVRELQSRLERQDEHVARLTLSLDRAECELRDREDLQRQLEAAAQLASCQVGELSAALIKWRSRDDDVRNTVEQLKQALEDAEDSVMRAVEDKQQCEQELVFLRRQSLLSASSPDPRGDRQTAPEAESTGDTVGVCSEPAALEVVCSIRDEIFQSIECDSCSEEVSRTLPLSGISSSAPFHGALLTPPTKGELASTVDTPDCRDRGSGISCGSLSWRDNVCVYSTSDDDSRVDVSDDSVLADTSLISHTLPRSNGLGEIVEHLQQLDVSSAASLIVSDDPTGVQSGDEDVTGGLVDEVVSSCPGSDPAVVDVMTFSSSDRDCSQSYDECCQVVINHLAERQRLRLLSDSPPLLSPGEYATIPHLSYQVQCALLAGVARAIAVLSSLQISTTEVVQECTSSSHRFSVQCAWQRVDGSEGGGTNSPVLLQLTDRDSSAGYSMNEKVMKGADDGGFENVDPVICSLKPDLGQIAYLQCGLESELRNIERRFGAVSLALRTDRLTLQQRVHVQQRNRQQLEADLFQQIRQINSHISSELMSCNAVCVDKDKLKSLLTQLEVVSEMVKLLNNSAEAVGAVEQELRCSETVEEMTQLVDQLCSSSRLQHSQLVHTRQMLALVGIGDLSEQTSPTAALPARPLTQRSNSFDHAVGDCSITTASLPSETSRSSDTPPSRAEQSSGLQPDTTEETTTATDSQSHSESNFGVSIVSSPLHLSSYGLSRRARTLIGCISSHLCVLYTYTVGKSTPGLLCLRYSFAALCLLLALLTLLIMPAGSQRCHDCHHCSMHDLLGGWLHLRHLSPPAV